ncbi:MAG: 6-carboxytetrahydropterin synthase [Bacteroidetes bacterium]|nr:6-carboxytetrahydropterin synthase [Bacteroidota bacterium]
MPIALSRKFTFEAAHALFDYDGPCRFVHGHSYKLEVRIESMEFHEKWIPAPGLLMDFRALDRLIKPLIQDNLDHRLLLSEDYLQKNSEWSNAENLHRMPFEPSVENLLFWLSDRITSVLPSGIRLQSLLLHETEKSAAFWSAT